jgi:hypothetical protein
LSTTKIEGKFRVGDLVWTAEECWLHVLSNLPHDVPTPVQRDYSARKGLPLIFMKYLPKDQWSDWMIESESMSKDGNSRMWCLVFFDGREWIVDQFDISGKDPGV